ncbi:tRNA lysidine(34) synthetase TilS [Denitratisoma sp. agr-D3]
MPDTGTIRFCVAYSGGLDSTVLLDAAATFCAASNSRIQLSAIHVNHGLSPNADAWEAHCRAQCQARGIPFEAVRVAVDRQRPSLEAEARRARYEAFVHVAADFILQAHHQDDQAETLLLNLLRGTGVLGAAGIPQRQGRVLRPLLACAQGELREYATRRGLHWIEDESNASTQHQRNYLRHQVLPELERRFHGARKNLATAASHFAQGQDLLEQLAEEDGAAEAPLPGHLLRQLGQEKGHARALNALAYNLRRQGLRLPSARWLDEAAAQLLGAGPDRQVCLRVGAHEIRRYRDRIFVLPLAEPPDLTIRPWQGESRAEWGGGYIITTPVRGEGIAMGRLTLPCSLRPRHGGEKICLDGKHHRSLKDLLRESDCPPWWRAKLPLLFHGDELIWVHGVGIAEKYRCGPEEDGITLEFACPTC